MKDRVKKQPQDDPEQSKRFEEAAHELDADKTGESFKRAMDGIVKKTDPSSDQTSGGPKHHK